MNHNTPWSQVELGVLSTNINRIPYKAIAEMLSGRTVGAVKQRASIMGFPRKGVKFQTISRDNSFFSKHTLRSAYWAGFIAADGCVVTSPRHELRIGIHKRDEDHLYKFISDVGYGGSVRIDKKNICHLCVSGAIQWTDDLAQNFNIFPRKTFDLKPPRLPLQEALAYSIGYIDGDGCWTTAGKQHQHLVLVVVGTENVLQWLVRIWNKAGAELGTQNLRFARNCWRLHISCAKARRVAKLLQVINTPKLERKWRVASGEASGQEV